MTPVRFSASSRSRTTRTRFKPRSREFLDDQISVYFTVRQFWGSGPETTFLESMRRQRQIGEEISRAIGRSPHRQAAGPGDRLALGAGWACRVDCFRIHSQHRGVQMPRLSSFARNLTAESAFTVLAVARALKSKGKDVVELEIGDSPFPTTPNAKRAGIKAIEDNETGYCPSLGLPDFRAAAAKFVSAEFGYAATAENIVIASGAKPFEQFFAEAVLDAGDGVLVFSPQFPDLRS